MTINVYVPNSSQLGTVLPPGHLAMSGDIFSCHIWMGALLLPSELGARDAAAHPIVHRTAS